MATIEEARAGGPDESGSYADQPLFRERMLSRFDCAGCGYGASRQTAPDRCPMCGSSAWDLVAWRPFRDQLVSPDRPEFL